MADHAFRAAVTDATGRVITGVWQFLSSRDEIYISIVDIARQFKTSLHSSEHYRIGFTTQEESNRFRAEGLDKAVHKWTPLPLTLAARVPFQILIPAAGLGTNVNNVARPDIYRLAAPDNDDVLVISVVESPAPARDDLLGPAATLIHQWSTSGGRHIAIATQLYAPTTAELNQWRDLIAARSEFDLATQNCEDERGRYDPRALLPLDSVDGMHRVMEFGIREFAMWATFTARDSHQRPG